MRCRNCGWDNPANSVTCEKCNQQLIERENRYTAPEVSQNVNFDSRKTMNEQMVFSSAEPQPFAANERKCLHCGYPLMKDAANCPKCGERAASGTPGNRAPKPTQRLCAKCQHPVAVDYSFCPNCGVSFVEKRNAPQPVNQEQNFGRTTVRPGKRFYCTLTLIPDENERLEPVPVSLSGEEIILNRNNTESDNMTITSKEQAALSYENGHWYIQDRSELKTTYLYISEKTELKPGDIIVMGDRRFKFDF